MSAPVLLGEQPRPAAPESVVAGRFDARKLRDHFECLVEANGGVDHFRGLIINLAIRGRLGTHDPSDAPADALLQLAARVLGGDQKRRNLDGRLEPEYRLPEGWCWCEPQDIGRIAPRNDVPDDLPVGFVPMTNVPTDYRRPVTYESRPWKEIKKGYTHVADGDIAVAKITPCFQNGKSCVVTGLPNGLGAGTTELLVLRPVPGVVHPNYLLLFFKSPDFLSHGVGLMTGTAGQQRVPVEYFASVPLPLPPLAEQKRIVAKVDQLMALCDDFEARQTKKREIGTRLTKSALETLTTAESPAEFDATWKRVFDNFSILVDTAEKVGDLKGAVRNLALRGVLTERGKAEPTGLAMLERIEAERERRVRAKQARRMDPLLPVSGDDVPFPVPATWAWARLGNLCWKVADGPHFSPKYVGREEGVPFLSGRNIRIEGFELESMKYVSHSDHRSFCERTKPERGDVLYTKGGTTGVALVNNLDFEFSVWVHVAVLKLDLANVDPQYVAMALNSPHCYQQSQKYTHGTGNRDLGLTRMVLITLPLPPLEEQKRIVTKVEHLMKVCDDLEAKLLRAEDRAARLVEAAVQELVAS